MSLLYIDKDIIWEFFHLCCPCPIFPSLSHATNKEKIPTHLEDITASVKEMERRVHVGAHGGRTNACPKGPSSDTMAIVPVSLLMGDPVRTQVLQHISTQTKYARAPGHYRLFIILNCTHISFCLCLSVCLSVSLSVCLFLPSLLSFFLHVLLPVHPSYLSIPVAVF